jgi:predicted RNA binding protein YcfA (HicA-like mRNA interferase family)
MDDQEFLRKLRKFAKARDGQVTVIAYRGKGSHREIVLEFGNSRHRTILSKGELPKGTLSAMLKQLGIPPRDF